MADARSRPTLARKILAGVLVGEFVLGLVLALTVGTLASIAVAQQHRESTHNVAGTLAVALGLSIMEDHPEHTAAALQAIVESTDLADVECIRVVGPTGEDMAAHGESGACMVMPGDRVSSDSPWDVLFRSRLVTQTVDVGAQGDAVVYVGLKPPDLPSVLALPALASVIVLVAVMVISVPWTLWLLNREVVRPLGRLEEYASRIAGGDLKPGGPSGSSLELHRLQGALETMAEQLGTQWEELRGSYAELEAAYAALEQAKTEIEELARIKEDFVAVAAHEIRAPLATIMLHSETLKTGEVGVLDDDAHGSVATIHAAASRLRSITSDLMDAALLERGELPIRFDTVWLDELVDEAIADGDALARGHKIRVRAAGGFVETVVYADRVRLRQVFDNLISNAIKYSPENTEVVVSMRVDAAEAVIEVADSGMGIKPADTTRLFTLFGRVDLGDSRQTAGLGLGLAISARIVQAHGGSVTYRENPQGAGSVFTVRLPLGEADGEAPEDATVITVARESEGQEGKTP